ncbi:hypothetical protein Plhal710r2_c041g0141941 [Plasmopara halstedii]
MNREMSDYSGELCNYVGRATVENGIQYAAAMKPVNTDTMFVHQATELAHPFNPLMMIYNDVNKTLRVVASDRGLHHKIDLTPGAQYYFTLSLAKVHHVMFGNALCEIKNDNSLYQENSVTS